MNKKNLLSKVLAFTMLAAIAFTSTSCNRGYGCPYNVNAAKIISAPLINSVK